MSYILIIEDDEATALLLKTYLKDINLPVILADTGHVALDHIKKDGPEIILLDLNLPDIDGISFIDNILNHTKNSEIIVVTGETSADKALTAINAGAKDYLVKPVDKKRLITTVVNSLERIELNRKIESLKFTQESEILQTRIIGSSKLIKELHKAIDQASKTSEPILLFGERGTGKFLIAETIHSLKNHPPEDFNFIDCSLYNEDDEEEFSNALQKPSKTLYLSNLSNLNNKMQTILLRKMNSEDMPSIIWSCINDPMKDVDNKELRDDLFYRLNVVRIPVPTLRAREKDIILLASYFLRQHAKEENKSFEDFTPKVLEIFINHHWPGNVRELSNVVKNIVVLNNKTKFIDIDIIPKHMLSSQFDEKITSNEAEDLEAEENENETESNNDQFFKDESIIPIRDLEEMAIRHALKICNGNIQQAAVNLKISPATLYRKKPPVH